MGHTLALLEHSPYYSHRFCCNLCQAEGCGPVYHCSDCDFDIHVSCAAVDAQQTHFSHPQHPLYLSHTGAYHRNCNSCGSAITAWFFRCDLCDFNIHSMCARAPQCILTRYHRDPLVLENASDVAGRHRRSFCNGCKMSITDLFYRCRMCKYNLHQVCATLPTEIMHVKHQAHMLTLVQDEPAREGFLPMCDECGELAEGWHFHCASCNFNLHPRCAQLEHKLPHAGFDGDPSNGTIMTDTSAAHGLSHAIDALAVSRHVSQTAVPSQRDWEVVERVLQFSKKMAKVHAAQEAAPRRLEEEQEDCPTCLEGFDAMNPKVTTSCGHHFHRPCIREWMKHSFDCPLCRKTLGRLV